MKKSAAWAIDGRQVGPEEPCFVIAEAGVNHNGDIGMAEELVRQAKAAGADCVKFQTFCAEDLVTPNAPKAAYQLTTTDPGESQLDMLRRLVLPREAYPRLIKLCRALGIVFLSTPYGFDDVDFLDGLPVSGFKVASGQLVEPRFLRHIALKGKPVILSTGMATLEEIGAAVEVFHSCGNGAIALLQCTTNYPAAVSDANVRAMAAMRAQFGVVAGYSDHTQTAAACLAAAALGAQVIEKHFTLDKSLPGPDHVCSADREEFRQLVQSIRQIELALGSDKKAPSAAELSNAKGMRRSIVAARDIAAGAVITDDDLTLKRPATGIKPALWETLIGRKTNNRIRKDALISPDDLDA